MNFIKKIFSFRIKFFIFFNSSKKQKISKSFLTPTINQSCKISSLKIGVFALLLFTISHYSIAQSWEFLGGPEGRVSNDILVTKSGRLLCSTWEGLYFSDDFGNSWTYSVSSQSYNGFFKLTQRTNLDIIAITRIGIAKSEDLGETWVLIYEAYALNDYGAIVCESPKDSSLYYGANRKLYKSKNDGFSWEEIWNGNVLDSYAIDDSGWIYVGERYVGLLQSKDDGNSFELISINYQLFDPIIEYIIPNHYGGLYLKIFGYPDPIIHYENDVVTEIYTGWTNVPLGLTSNGELIYKAGNCIACYNPVTRTSSTISCPYFVKDQFARKVVTYENIWVTDFYTEGLHYSSDAGKSWNEITSGRGFKYCTSVEVTKGGKIFIGTFNSGFWGSLYQSLDDGRNWTRKNPARMDASFFDISKLKNGGLIGSGTYGAFTSDGEGENWTKRPGLQIVNSQYVSNKGFVFVGNEYHGIYVSKNNGINWSEANGGLQPTTYLGFGEGYDNRIFASSMSNGTYFSDDDATSWTKIESNLLTYSTAYDFKSYNDTIYAGTRSGVIFSDDNGITWQRFGNMYESVRKILIALNGDILAATRNKGIYRFIRERRQWQTYNIRMENRDVSDITFDKYLRIIAVSDSGVFRSNEYISKSIVLSPPNNSTFNSNNVELKWNHFPSVINYHLQLAKDSLFTMLIIDDSLLTDSSTYLRSLDFLSTYYWRVGVELGFGSFFSDIASFTIGFPNQYSLRQNYPNPFNSSTSIVFDVPIDSKINLKVYDVLGQLVQIIAVGDLVAGTHKYIWQAGNLPSGAYFIRLEADDYVQTKKALLLK